jgi:hypothetical protein
MASDPFVDGVFSGGFFEGKFISPSLFFSVKLSSSIFRPLLLCAARTAAL